jgi:thiol-disulfide isomerase/thioredoxin
VTLGRLVPRLEVVGAALVAALFIAPPVLAAPEVPKLSGELDAKGYADAVARRKGEVVLVNFWATWCVPCREEFPDLARLDRAWRGRGLAVLGVTIDSAKDLPAVDKFLAKTKPGFPNYRKASGGDDQVFIEAVDEKWGGELPFTVLYSRDGKKAKVLSGKQSYAAFESAVKGLLN